MKLKLVLAFLVLVLFGVSIFSLKLVNKNDKVVVNELEIRNNYNQTVKSFSELSYINYDEVFAKSKKDINKEGRYSDLSPDNKINWKENHYYKKSTILAEVFKKISLDGESINLPLTFEEMGWDFKPFENIEDSKITKENLPLHFKNIKNSFFFEVVEFKEDIAEYEDGRKFNFSTCYGVVGFQDRYLINLGYLYRNKNKKIINLQTSADPGIESQYDLRIAGLGIGNTFNEAYELLGSPYQVIVKGDKKLLRYSYTDTNNLKIYILNLEHNPYIADARTKEYAYVNNNVITTIDITSLDVKDTKIL